MKRFLTWVCSIAILVAPGAEAKLNPVVCGTYRDKGLEELHLHRQSMRVRSFRGISRMAASAAAADVGNIAILSDADGVVAHQNPFDLQGLTLAFIPNLATAASYRFSTSGGSYSVADASAGTPLANLDDDDTRKIILPFAFPFYGTTYTEAWVNSDGNITFGTGDTDTSARSVGRFTSGPPRIGPLFEDLDPSQQLAAVTVLSESGRVVISWVGVPEYTDFGTGARQTFQVRLFPGGRVEFAWLIAGTANAVTGITPGNLQGTTTLLSFTGTESQVYTGTLAERFGNTDGIDYVLAAQKFYETHEDAYDYLVFFNSLGIEAAPGALALTTPVRVPFKGIGDVQRDYGAGYGSPYRLQAIMNMGPVTQYPLNPYNTVPNRGEVTGDTTLTLLGHEAGHLWLALASVRDAGNPSARPMLGTALVHWSFNFNSEASLLEGERIRDDGAAVDPRFTTIATVQGYSPLDQYLMGLRSPSEVPPTFLVRNSPYPNARFPQVGIRISGDRRDIGIDEIIAAEGRRTPDSTVSPTSFRFAFILIAADANPSPDVTQQLETYRTEFLKYYPTATSGRATAEIDMKKSLHISLWPASGVLLGGNASATITLARSTDHDVTVQLSAANGVAQMPAQVTIPAGQTAASFTVTGLKAGVEDVTASASDTQYEVGHARVQVLAAASALRLEASAGDRQTATPGVALPQEIVVRALDTNDVPYPAQALKVDVVGGGSTNVTSGTTDALGQFHILWTPGAGPRNELHITQVNNPVPPLVVRAFGAPAATAEGAVNAASYRTGISPGSFATLFGANLSGGAGLTVAPFPYPQSLEGVRLTLNGRAMQIYAFTDDQINFLTPPDLATGPADLVVETPLGTSTAVQVNIDEPRPGLFYNTANGMAAARQHGRIAELYGTGFGPLKTNANGLDETTVPVEVTIGGLRAKVLFAGLSPGTPGLHQINIEVPAELAAGIYKLTAKQGDAVTNEVKLAVQP